jgi:hypothetical protein
MHCLDSIRHLYWGHDKNADADPVVNERILKKHHIDHCFDSLRQSIMCAADISPVPYNWVPSMGLALGSLGVPHTCRSKFTGSIVTAKSANETQIMTIWCSGRWRPRETSRDGTGRLNQVLSLEKCN